MGKKRAQKNNPHPTGSFQQTVAKAVNSQLTGYINEQIQKLAMVLGRRQSEELEGVYHRVMALERICLNKFNMEEDELAMVVADLEDESLGLEVFDTVESGDLLRLEISTKQKNEEKFQDATRTKVSNVGSGQTFGPEIESQLIGMKVNEVKEIEFGKEENKMIVKVMVQRISRSPKKEEPQEKSNEDSNAQ